MKPISHCLTLVLFAASAALVAQTTPRPAVPMLSATAAGVTRYAPKTENPNVGPFSRLALGGGVSPLGINLQAAVNVNRFINLRGVGNIFNYTVRNISTNGLNINGKLNFATAGASVDFYPFPNHGFRLSPGALF